MNCQTLRPHSSHIYDSGRNEREVCGGVTESKEPAKVRTPICGNDYPHAPHSYGGWGQFCNGTERPKSEAKAGGLTRWWIERAHAEIADVEPKAIEYGSNSLTQMGHKVAALQNRTVEDEEARELGIWVNLVQKVERWTDAVLRGDKPSDDTLHDIVIYAKMAQRNRAVGNWPGEEQI